MNDEVLEPFGLLFLESAPPPEKRSDPVYDNETDISYISVENGDLVPFVESQVNEETKSTTGIAREGTDKDVTDTKCAGAFVGTNTGTRIKLETTDKDNHDLVPVCWTMLGTKTLTFVNTEPTDSDD
ncbi:MAG: hypothetical protein KJ970_03425 [Candidatus Eisenbacteria bacterium]|uniref:Uncharacterized protein n=1 Tax=Eiseniibacteriota bacterium TaxID=2212470 RepID=A0A948RVX5_UNCEI|nr:hypothetical protein [Candidatus Eisenbacteria bacterium]MBU2689952.1 hypothetical protein [Candidatus Eisenbacteria bacterium]